MDLQGIEERSAFHRNHPEIFETLAHQIPHLAWVADSHGRMFWWNQRWFDYTGKHEADMQGDGWKRVFHPHHIEKVIAGLNQSFETGAECEDVVQMSNGRGGWRWFLSKVVPVHADDGQINYFIGTYTDITERRKYEEELKHGRETAEALVRSKSDLLVNMSREIRIPMNTILGFASLMKDSSLSEEERSQFADRIISSGDQLLQIIDDILNLSKFDSGKTEIEHVRFNMSDLVFDIVQAMKTASDKKDIKLMVFFNSAIPKLLTSDPHRVRQILTNLIGNAIKYTGTGGRILISLEFQESSKYGAALSVDVEDTGIGISREQQPKIFLPFAQLDSNYNKSGHRLGLALSEKLAESLGGSLSLKASEVGQGSCFSLVIPVGDIKDVEFIKGKKSEPFARKLLSSFKKSKRLENVRVLLAEDSADNETLVRLYLEKEGASITYAHNGLEVLDYVKNGNYDIILMDIQMPLLDGLEATRQLRQNGFQKPIVALTAHALEGDVEKSLKAGCDTHLTKPIRGEILIEEIQKRVFH